MPLSTKTKVLLFGGIPALGVAWLIGRSDGKSRVQRDPLLGSEQWASRQAANSMASAPSSLLSRSQLKAYSVMDDKAAAQRDRYQLRHPGGHSPFFTPTPGPGKPPIQPAPLPQDAAMLPPPPPAAAAPPSPPPAVVSTVSPMPAPPLPLSVLPAAPAAAPPASAAHVRGLLREKGAPAAPPRARHRYPLPTGLTVTEALDVLVRDVARHAAFVVRLWAAAAGPFSRPRPACSPSQLSTHTRPNPAQHNEGRFSCHFCPSNTA